MLIVIRTCTLQLNVSDISRARPAICERWRALVLACEGESVCVGEGCMRSPYLQGNTVGEKVVVLQEACNDHDRQNGHLARTSSMFYRDSRRFCGGSSPTQASSLVSISCAACVFHWYPLHHLVPDFHQW